MKSLSACIDGTVWKNSHFIPCTNKPHGRIVYTLAIGADWYIDLSVMCEEMLKDDDDFESEDSYKKYDEYKYEKLLECGVPLTYEEWYEYSKQKTITHDNNRNTRR